MNKLIIMLPVMFAARRLDSEDPQTVYWLRIAYGVIQTICLLAVVYTYYRATLVSSLQTVVYVPPPPQPFADPNAKKKYTETSYGAHVLSTARSLLGSTLVGVVMTLGLHYYRGMVMGLAMQVIMAPLNLAENALVKALVFGKGMRVEDRIFDEKIASELTADDEVVDAQGNPVVRNAQANATGEEKSKTLEDIMLDTWDAGNAADITELMAAINKKNCNHQTAEEKSTPLMILAGLRGVKGTTSAIKQVMELGGNCAITDKDGWTPLHWAAYHGSVEAAKEFVKTESKLLNVKDREGNTPEELALKEKNEEVAAVYAEARGETKKDK